MRWGEGGSYDFSWILLILTGISVLIRSGWQGDSFCRKEVIGVKKRWLRPVVRVRKGQLDC